MKRAHKSLWLMLMIGVLTLPLLQTSCVEITQRTLINGFFGGTTPVLDGCLEDWLREALGISADS